MEELLVLLSILGYAYTNFRLKGIIFPKLLYYLNLQSGIRVHKFLSILQTSLILAHGNICYFPAIVIPTNLVCILVKYNFKILMIVLKKSKVYLSILKLF